MTFDRRAFESILSLVEKPGRYLGNERGAVHKDPRQVALRFALAFPEVYEIAQSHPGLQILYDLLNRRTDVYAERVYAPWLDMEAHLRERRLPLVSLETFTPVCEFDIVGFSLQYELTYTNLLMMLDLGGIPLLSAERDTHHPLVIAGGPCAFNPEPLAGFLDAVLLGDGEDAVHDICDVVLAWNRRDRSALLDALATIPGVYVPSLYTAEYDDTGAYQGTRPLRDDLPTRVEKRILADLDTAPPQETFVVPNMKIVHARPSLEVMRGCVKGCRFCQAGYVYRPLREHHPQRVLDHAQRALTATGTDELSLLSLSTGDYSCVNPVLTELMNRFAADRVAISLPSTRVDALAPSLLEQIRRVRKTGFTLAPEAGTQRMRDLIQKEYGENELLEAARQIFNLGWRSLKLYFMIGLPGEREEDLIGIAELAARVAAEAPRGAEVTASISTFVPKSHTPFQWAAQIDREETRRRQDLVHSELRRRRLRFKWHDADASFLEGIISRGDRRVGDLILAAYRLGCRFDGWSEACRMDLWERALHETRIDPDRYLRRRLLDESLPWDHIGAGVTRKFLARELANAMESRLTPDCSVERCTACGACDFRTVRNVDYHLHGARGGEHRGERIAHWASGIVGDEAGGEDAWEPLGWHRIRERIAARRSGKTAPHLDPVGQSPLKQATTAPTRSSGKTARSTATGGQSQAEEWLSARTDGLAAPSPAHPEPPIVRVRLTYRKRERARFIGHLDLIEVFTSAFRRAALPVAFSGGYRPAPRVRFSPGLPLGCESDCEVIDVDLTRALPAAAVADAIDEQLPPGLSVVDSRVLPLDAPAVERELTGMRYRLRLLEEGDGKQTAWVDRRIADFLASETFPITRRTRKGERVIDARPLVAGLTRADERHLELDLRFTGRASVRPSDLFGALLALDATAVRALPLRKTRCFYRTDPSPGVCLAPAVETRAVG